MEIRTAHGYDLYEVASALQKAIRRSNIKLAGYMALELFPKYAEYCWRRLLTVSAEDCYGIVTKEIMALYDAYQIINKTSKETKGRIFISKAVILLCLAGKNRDADILSNFIYDKKIDISDEEINALFDDIRKEPMTMPAYVYDVHTKQGRMRGKRRSDFFIEEQRALDNKQMSLFDGIVEQYHKKI